MKWRRTKITEPDNAVEWLKQLLAGSPDFFERESIETKVRQEDAEAFRRQLMTDQSGQMTYWHQLLVIFGESWHDGDLVYQ